jgi:hypothetical protein
MNLTYISELDQVQPSRIACVAYVARRIRIAETEKGVLTAPTTDLGIPRVTIDRIQQIL